MQVTPLAEFRFTHDVIVGHIHTSGIGHLTIDNHDFAVVAVSYVVKVRKAYGVEFINFDTSCPQAVKMSAAQRTVVRAVAESIEERTNLYAFGCFVNQKRKQFFRNRVIPEVEVL